MPKDKPAGKSGLAEQRALAGTESKKENGSPLKEGAGRLERLQRCHRATKGEN